MESYLAAFVGYLTYLGSGLALLFAFSAAYVLLTPLAEFRLIREGKVAVALSFGGALVGFSLTLASSAWHANKLQYFVAWGVLAMVVQLLVRLLLGIGFKGLAEALEKDNVAVGAFAGVVSLSVGLINAGALS